mgnify:CR=1 FL=1
MSEASVLVNVDADGIGVMTLNRPDMHNAFDEHLIADITAKLKKLDRDPKVRVVVMAGNGRSFSAGADLNWMKRMAKYTYAQNLKDARALAEMLKTLDRLYKPTIARVHGHAFAGGTGLVAVPMLLSTVDAAVNDAISTPLLSMRGFRYTPNAFGNAVDFGVM